MYGSYDAVCCMKTTVELNDDLLHRAKQIAAAEGTTLRALLEAGLRSELVSREQREYSLMDASVSGQGVQAGVEEGNWDGSAI